MSGFSFWTNSGKVVMRPDGLWEAEGRGTRWIVDAGRSSPIEVTPTGPYIPRVVDVDDPLATVFTLMMVARERTFSTHPPELADEARRMYDRMTTVPEGATP